MVKDDVVVYRAKTDATRSCCFCRKLEKVSCGDKVYGLVRFAVDDENPSELFPVAMPACKECYEAAKEPKSEC